MRSAESWITPVGRGASCELCWTRDRLSSAVAQWDETPMCQKHLDEHVEKYKKHTASLPRAAFCRGFDPAQLPDGGLLELVRLANNLLLWSEGYIDYANSLEDSNLLCAHEELTQALARLEAARGPG